ncbi:MAG: hypothetical protein ACXWK8_07485 [Myxococcaceae bacterium]
MSRTTLPPPFLLAICLLMAVAGPDLARASTPEYRTVNASQYGKAVVTERTDARNLRTALQLTQADITRYFGAPPTVFSAFADSKDPRSGGATFRVVSGGVESRGLVTCSVGDTSTRVAVTWIRSDAPAGEWARLLQKPPPSSPGPVSAAAQPEVAHGPLRTHVFPDGTGSIGLAEGWSTDAQTATRTAVLQGPGDAAITMGAFFTVMTPQSTLPRTQGTLVAPFTTPIEVLQALVPQFSQLSVRQGGPSRTIDHLTKLSDQKANLPGGKSSVLQFGVTENGPGGTSKHFQGIAWVEVDPVSAGSFMLSLTQVRAPDAIFEKTKPVMFQMLRSLKTNDAVIQQKSNQQVAAQKQWFANQQKAMRAQQAANDAHNQQYWDNQKAREASNRSFEDSQRDQARRNDDFDEYIRGFRTVEDTQTGIKTSVDLGNVDKIVDDLNVHDPGRYRQIPLRDEADPLPSR